MYAVYLSQWFTLTLLQLFWDTASPTAPIFLLVVGMLTAVALHHGVEKPAAPWAKRIDQCLFAQPLPERPRS